MLSKMTRCFATPGILYFTVLRPGGLQPHSGGRGVIPGQEPFPLHLCRHPQEGGECHRYHQVPPLLFGVLSRLSIIYYIYSIVVASNL